MKKTFAISLLFIHLFNIAGYQFFFTFQEKKADEQMMAFLDAKKYNESDLVQIKIAMNLPYTVDSKECERFDGSIVLNGVQYNYVKRMVQNDTMYLYCIANHQKTELNNTKNELAKQATDVPLSKKADQSGKASNFFNDYYQTSANYNLSALINSFNKPYSVNNNNTLQGFIPVPAQPPEA